MAARKSNAARKHAYATAPTIVLRPTRGGDYFEERPSAGRRESRRWALALSAFGLLLISWHWLPLSLPLFSSVFNRGPFKPGETYFAEHEGLLVIEAEHSDVNVSRNGRSWRFEKGTGEFRGEGYVVSEPTPAVEHWDYTTQSPELTYRVRFEHPGTYLVSLRGYALDEAANSVHLGLDRIPSPSSEHLSTRDFGHWTMVDHTMSGQIAAIEVRWAGYHTIQVWMREAGFKLDRITLTLQSRQAQMEREPDESPRMTF